VGLATNSSGALQLVDSKTERFSLFSEMKWEYMIAQSQNETQ
jgi:hypothetical protein